MLPPRALTYWRYVHDLMHGLIAARVGCTLEEILKVPWRGQTAVLRSEVNCQVLLLLDAASLDEGRGRKHVKHIPEYP
jgi:hypothetical protein